MNTGPEVCGAELQVTRPLQSYWASFVTVQILFIFFIYKYFIQSKILKVDHRSTEGSDDSHILFIDSLKLTHKDILSTSYLNQCSFD